MNIMDEFDIGDRVRFCTFDVEDGDTRELDGSTATVLQKDAERELLKVTSMYGDVWYDVYGFQAAS